MHDGARVSSPPRRRRRRPASPHCVHACEHINQHTCRESLIDSSDSAPLPALRTNLFAVFLSFFFLFPPYLDELFLPPPLPSNPDLRRGVGWGVGEGRRRGPATRHNPLRVLHGGEYQKPEARKEGGKKMKRNEKRKEGRGSWDGDSEGRKGGGVVWVVWVWCWKERERAKEKANMTNKPLAPAATGTGTGTGL